MPDWGGWPFAAEDPYPQYRDARARAPVQWLPRLGAHVVLSYQHAQEAMRDSDRWSSDLRNNPELLEALGGPGPGAELFTSALLTRDPPAHTRLRSAVNRFFTPRAADRIRSQVAATADAAIAPFAEGGPFELIEDLATLIPIAVICELFDIGAEGAELLRERTPDLAGLLEQPDERVARAGWHRCDRRHVLPRTDRRRSQATPARGSDQWAAASSKR